MRFNGPSWHLHSVSTHHLLRSYLDSYRVYGCIATFEVDQGSGVVQSYLTRSVDLSETEVVQSKSAGRSDPGAPVRPG